MSNLNNTLKGVLIAISGLVALIIIIMIWNVFMEHGHVKRSMEEKCSEYQDCLNCKFECSAWEWERIDSEAAAREKAINDYKKKHKLK